MKVVVDQGVVHQHYAVQNKLYSDNQDLLQRSWVWSYLFSDDTPSRLFPLFPWMCGIIAAARL